MTPAAAKYLRRNPTPPLAVGACRCAVVIPAYRETTELPAALDALFSAPRVEPTAVIVAVNHPPGADAAASLATLEQLKSRPVHTLYLPELAGGVGAARKAAMDAFLAGVPPEEWDECVIFSLDADTWVEQNYFTAAVPEVRRHGAVTFGFRHRPAATAELQSAIDRYEAYLRRYAAKLREAGSPYAYTAIGSAFAVRGDVYLRSGGMKVRTAGEDFYFLQAAAKVGGVKELPEVVVHPSPRVSERVPFGTGPAVAELLRGGRLNEVPDAAFAELKKTLATATDADLADAAGFLARLPENAAEFFRRERFAAAWERVRANLPRRPGAAVRAFHEWFDALKTLRFLHLQAEFSEKNAAQG